MTSSGQANVRYILFLASILVITLVMGGLLSKAPQGLRPGRGCWDIALYLVFLQRKVCPLYLDSFHAAFALSSVPGRRKAGDYRSVGRLMLPLIGFSWFARTAIYKNLGLLKRRR